MILNGYLTKATQMFDDVWSLMLANLLKMTTTNAFLLLLHFSQGFQFHSPISSNTPFHFAGGGGICALQQLVSWELKMSWDVFVFV